jgi:hypothetical protein
LPARTRAHSRRKQPANQVEIINQLCFSIIY